MNVLLPNYLKKVGIVIGPLGFLAWLSYQLGYAGIFFNSFFGVNIGGREYYFIRTSSLKLAFLAFLFGFYCKAFSKESTEDEMVQRLRLESFQFASVIQIAMVMIFFTALLFRLVPEPRDSGMMLFFAALTLLFWISYVVRFNYELYIRDTNE